MDHQEWKRIFQTGIIHPHHTWRLEFTDDLLSANETTTQYKRTTSAWFTCRRCGRPWPSNEVKVIFYIRHADDQGTVIVKVFGQSCKNCEEAPMETPQISLENIEILMHELVEMIKIYFYHEEDSGRRWNPIRLVINSTHEPDHCEGCKNGMCG
ncbi:receptor-transporting protein 3-like [Cololabis saira]|uniref:receptor-transporting protein 3-like n=1 Tax=Cololabis saira TaxID=129043 RepID=UPI002AD4A5CA|nr:receptor-transporting protein 3-like [Cololabis saira]